MTCYATSIDSPVSRLHVAVDGDGALAGLEFATHRTRESFAASLPEDVIWDEAPCRGVVVALAAYFGGDRTALDGLAVAPRGTDFQRAVWRAVRSVPYGRTASYGEIARVIGCPGASRAVGQANGANPVCLVIPCHRVVGSDGSLTGFGGGIEVKRKLLDLEARHGT